MMSKDQQILTIFSKEIKHSALGFGLGLHYWLIRATNQEGVSKPSTPNNFGVWMFAKEQERCVSAMLIVNFPSEGKNLSLAEMVQKPRMPFWLNSKNAKPPFFINFLVETLLNLVHEDVYGAKRQRFKLKKEFLRAPIVIIFV